MEPIDPDQALIEEVTDLLLRAILVDEESA